MKRGEIEEYVYEAASRTRPKRELAGVVTLRDFFDYAQIARDSAKQAAAARTAPIERDWYNGYLSGYAEGNRNTARILMRLVRGERARLRGEAKRVLSSQEARDE